MFLAQLKNELWKLFGKKRTYIGFGAFLLAQTAMLLAFKYTRWQSDFERLLNGNGYLASEFISVLTVSVVMLIPQIMLLMPLYATLVGGDLVAKEAEDGTLRMILSRPISRVRLLFVKWSAGIIFAVVLVLALGLTAMGFASLLFPWKGMFVFSPGQAFSVLSAHEGLVRFIFSHPVHGGERERDGVGRVHVFVLQHETGGGHDPGALVFVREHGHGKHPVL